MSEMKYRWFTFTNGKRYPILQTDSGQLVVGISPYQWDSLDDDEKEAIVQLDILLAAEWAGGATWDKQQELAYKPIWEV